MAEKRLSGLAKRRKAHRWGQISEYIAAIYLVLKGYRILAIRYKTKLGEIDLILRKQNLIIFVEVKARHEEMVAVDAVAFASQNRIRAASDIWLAKRPNSALLSQRYDIVAVLPWRLPRHFEDAF